MGERILAAHCNNLALMLGWLEERNNSKKLVKSQFNHNHSKWEGTLVSDPFVIHAGCYMCQKVTWQHHAVGMLLFCRDIQSGQT